MLEFDTSIGGCEVPVGFGVVGIAVALCMCFLQSSFWRRTGNAEIDFSTR